MCWTKHELKVLRRLDCPCKVQRFLDKLEYDPEISCKSPRVILRKRKAHCFEGAIFASACLELQGYKPLLVDLRAVNDDDHIMAVYKKDGFWGAVAKSNFNVLRYREPVYKSIRELALSYFDLYFNTLGEKTLREYSKPMDLNQFNKQNWRTTEKDISFIGDALDEMPHYSILTLKQKKNLSKADETLMKLALHGANHKGVYKPKKKEQL
ncbi:MAG: hypothetical protein FJY77_04395 [Candidatus Altiarchaeales archaeon]|nr:hypothetical protein [Candidatus Altiarchaeales archaeon]